VRRFIADAPPTSPEGGLKGIRFATKNFLPMSPPSGDVGGGRIAGKSLSNPDSLIKISFSGELMLRNPL
jgi:hypothetical protein